MSQPLATAAARLSTEPATPLLGSLVKIRGNERILYADNVAEAERFIEEMNYLNFYLKEIGRILGSRTIQMGVLEEENQQVVFKNYTTVQSQEIETHGMFVKRHMPLKTLLSQMP